MKTFKILGQRTLIEYVTYTVEAESEEEALEMVKNGEVDDDDNHWTKDTGDETYEIQK